MYIEENYAERIQKYLDPDTTIHHIVNLRSTADPRHLELLAITSASVVKYRRERKQEILDMIYLRHITGIQLAFDRLHIGRLVAGIILISFGFFLFISGLALSFSYYSGSTGVIMMLFGLSFLGPGIFLIVSTLRRRGGNLRINSYEEGYVDARFARENREQVIGINIDLQKLLAVGIKATSTPVIPAPVVPAPVVTPNVKPCAACGSEIRMDSAYCDKCGAKQ